MIAQQPRARRFALRRADRAMNVGRQEHLGPARREVILEERPSQPAQDLRALELDLLQRARAEDQVAAQLLVKPDARRASSATSSRKACRRVRALMKFSAGRSDAAWISSPIVRFILPESLPVPSISSNSSRYFCPAPSSDSPAPHSVILPAVRKRAFAPSTMSKQE